VKKRNTPMIIVLCVLGLLLVAYFVFNEPDQNRYQWHESYDANSSQPYGTLFLRRMLEDYHPGGSFEFNDKKPLKTLLNSDRYTSNSGYVFVGGSLFLDPQDADALLAFVRNGNDAVIACLEPPESLIYRIHANECDQQIEFQGQMMPSVTVNFYHDTLRTESGYTYAKRFRDEDISYNWKSFAPGLFCEAATTIVPIGYQVQDRVNFLRIKYGEGFLYIHANPIVFTNYFMIKDESVNYATATFSHLRGENIIWDEYSKIPFMGKRDNYDSPLYFILQQDTLKYAWWLMLITIGLYVFFAARRTQRVIPVLESKSNTSLEFVKLIASLHYQNENHLDMARKKMKYFLYFIRSKYGVHAQTFTDLQIAKLAEKSKVSLEEVQMIFTQYQAIERNAGYNINGLRLVDFYNAIENFYKHCK